MGELERGSPLRIWVGEKEESKTNMLGVIIYRKRLPKEVSFDEVRKSLLVEIEKAVKNSPYPYWVAPKARSWMNR